MTYYVLECRNFSYRINYIFLDTFNTDQRYFVKNKYRIIGNFRDDLMFAFRDDVFLNRNLFKTQKLYSESFSIRNFLKFKK